MARTRKSKNATIVHATTEASIVAEVAIADAIDEAVAQHDEDEKVRGRSVVPLGYKQTYAARAVRNGHATKAAKRSNSDWLALELEAECVPNGKGPFDLQRFAAILEANGGGNALERWPNRNSGWEGRLRMSGGVILRSIVRKNGFLVTVEGAKIEAPADFLAR
jgi:hypothetical protein